jgi:hypothetical protein
MTHYCRDYCFKGWRIFLLHFDLILCLHLKRFKIYIIVLFCFMCLLHVHEDFFLCMHVCVFSKIKHYSNLFVTTKLV